MTVTVDDEDLATRFCNIRTLGQRLGIAGRRGNNVTVAGVDGTHWTPNKPLDALYFPLSMWIVGCDEDGLVPHDAAAQAQLRAHLDWLYGLLDATDALRVVVDTATARQVFAEMAVAVAPTTMAAGTRADVDLELTVPAGCATDVAQRTNSAALTAAGTLDLADFAGGNLPLLDLEIELTAPASNVHITSVDGSWVDYNGALGAGVTRLVTGPWWQAYRTAAPATSLLSAVEWGPRPRFTVPVPRTGNPQISWTAAGTSGASQILVRGRRRWRSL